MELTTRRLEYEQLSDSDLQWADIVLMSGMAIQYASMTEVLRRCHQAGVRSVVGGPHATSSPEKLEDADHFVLDEGEITLPAFFEDLRAQCPQRIYRAGNRKPDVTKTPIPRFDLLKMDSYVNMCIQYSRGRLLFLDPNRVQYLRFMLWVLRRHPQKFLFALTRTLAGYHFIRYTADVMVPRLTLLESELAQNRKPAKLAG